MALKSGLQGGRSPLVRTCCFNGDAYRRNPVGRRAVHDDDIAGPQERDQNLFDISEEGSPHGAIQRHGGSDALQPEAPTKVVALQ